MNKLRTTVGILALSAGAASAGGIDRSGQSIGIIFETGNYAEFSFGSVRPDISGTAVATLGGFSSGNMAQDYTQISGAVKFKLGENLDAAVIFDQPFGADVSYPVLAVPPAVYYAAGSVAELNTSSITGVLKYRLPSNISLIGGLRYQTMEANATVPFVASYDVTGDRDGGVGYLVGVSYEKPEIALRVALTYNSSIKHTLSTTESSLLTGGADVFGSTPIETPQSVNLEFQTGVAKDTLVFGSVRWVDWSAFVIDPTNYPAGDPLVSYDSDTTNFTLGVGRRFNENWAAALTLGYEKPTGGSSSNLGPTDGRRSITLGATYTKDKMKISAGVSYVQIGDTYTELPTANPAANFVDNTAIGIGVKVGFSF